MKIKSEQLRSSAAAARELGINRDSLMWALRMGAPEPAQRVAGRRAFTMEEIKQIRIWQAGRNKAEAAKGGARE